MKFSNAIVRTLYHRFPDFSAAKGLVKVCELPTQDF